MATDMYSAHTPYTTHVIQSTSALINHNKTECFRLALQCYKHLFSYACIHCHSTWPIMQGSDQLMEQHYYIAAMCISILVYT